MKIRKIILIDSYDRFTINLYHYLSSLKTNEDVVRNDKLSNKEHIKRKYDKNMNTNGTGNKNQ